MLPGYRTLCDQQARIYVCIGLAHAQIAICAASHLTIDRYDRLIKVIYPHVKSTNGLDCSFDFFFCYFPIIRAIAIGPKGLTVQALCSEVFPDRCFGPKRIKTLWEASSQLE